MNVETTELLECPILGKQNSRPIETTELLEYPILGKQKSRPRKLNQRSTVGALKLLWKLDSLKRKESSRVWKNTQVVGWNLEQAACEKAKRGWSSFKQSLVPSNDENESTNVFKLGYHRATLSALILFYNRPVTSCHGVLNSSVNRTQPVNHTSNSRDAEPGHLVTSHGSDFTLFLKQIQSTTVIWQIVDSK